MPVPQVHSNAHVIVTSERFIDLGKRILSLQILEKGSFHHLPLEVMKRKLVSLTEKLISVPSMDDFS